MIRQSEARAEQAFSAAAFAFSGAVKLPAKAAMLCDGENAIAFHRSLTTLGAGACGPMTRSPVVGHRAHHRPSSHCYA
jgi:hypothetical protein